MDTAGSLFDKPVKLGHVILAFLLYPLVSVLLIPALLFYAVMYAFILLMKLVEATADSLPGRKVA